MGSVLICKDIVLYPGPVRIADTGEYIIPVTVFSFAPGLIRDSGDVPAAVILVLL